MTRSDTVRITSSLRNVLSTSSRLLQLISLLSTRPSWTAGELAERVEVTERTVRRDIAKLRDLGYGVDSDPGPWGGYRLGSRQHRHTARTRRRRVTRGDRRVARGGADGCPRRRSGGTVSAAEAAAAAAESGGGAAELHGRRSR